MPQTPREQDAPVTIMSTPDDKPAPQGQFLIYATEDGQAKIDVRIEGETVWLTQQHMAELFQTSVPNISMHLRNIYADGELREEATVKDFLTVRTEGSRQVSRSGALFQIVQTKFLWVSPK